jgi:predicted anti-sigma-YlaC factor YlaD
MLCTLSRELVSADLDGELAADERWLLAQHLEACPGCRWYSARAAELHRNVRVQAAPPVPDLTAAVLARLDDPPPADRAERGSEPPLPSTSPPRRSALGWRLGLALVGLLQLALAGPELIQHADGTGEQHLIHHLNAWTVAFAIGLLVVAWQPWRVRGVLPIATALAGVMIFTVVLDMQNDHLVAMPLTAHLLELAGLVLAWGLARHERAGGGDPRSGDGLRRRRRGAGGVTRPVWLRAGGRHPGAWARTAAGTDQGDRAA